MNVNVDNPGSNVQTLHSNGLQCLRRVDVFFYGGDSAVLDCYIANGANAVLSIDNMTALQQQIVVCLRRRRQRRQANNKNCSNYFDVSSDKRPRLPPLAIPPP